MKRVGIIFGTRPEAIKLLPVYLAARAHGGLDPVLISTGQHREMVREVLDLFRRRLDHDLDVMEPNQTLASLSGRIFSSLGPLMRQKFDAVFVQGDTTSAMVAGMVGFYAGVPCAHVEAGLRTDNIHSPFPEEFNRRVISLTARWHFAPTRAAAANLHREGVSRDVHVVGNTSIDAALAIARTNSGPSERLIGAVPELLDGARPVILVTAHRRENFGAPLLRIIRAVVQIARENPDALIVWPVHPNPNVRGVVLDFARTAPNIRAIDPVRYDDLIFLIRRSRIVLTDSGGIQEEAPAFSKPVIVLRDETERPEGIDAGCGVLAGADTRRIVEWHRRIAGDEATYARMCAAKNPYGDGEASRRIVETVAAALMADDEAPVRMAAAAP
jgi:UDP-N-acetylglucosamine 2-epimerase (non-hydrolysing)